MDIASLGRMAHHTARCHQRPASPPPSNFPRIQKSRNLDAGSTSQMRTVIHSWPRPFVQVALNGQVRGLNLSWPLALLAFDSPHPRRPPPREDVRLSPSAVLSRSVGTSARLAASLGSNTMVLPNRVAFSSPDPDWWRSSRLGWLPRASCPFSLRVDRLRIRRLYLDSWTVGHSLRVGRPMRCPQQDMTLFPYSLLLGRIQVTDEILEILVSSR